ncbi:MAG: HAD-IIA family hydrolase [Candidatus Villigracilaceae bacterium]
MNKIRGLILDLDGVLWRDQEPIGDLQRIFSRLQTLDLQVMLATNNATRTPAQYVEKLHRFGVEVSTRQIVNSAIAAAHLLSERFPQGGTLYVIGETGIRMAVQERGFTLLEDFSRETTPLAVVVSMDRSVTYQKLRAATLFIRAGAAFYATNTDRTFPTPVGLVPGAGAIVAAVSAATDQQPIVAGKPQPVMMQICLERMGLHPQQVLVVGDRLETDIAGGQAAQCHTALVLSGVSTPQQANAWHPPVDLIVSDLTALLEKWPPVL